jgi:hypothetical protein
MFADEQIAVRSVAIRKSGHEAGLRAACATANTWTIASARTRRAHRASMSPAQFLALVAGWGAGVVLLLFVSAAARYLG